MQLAICKIMSLPAPLLLIHFVIGEEVHTISAMTEDHGSHSTTELRSCLPKHHPQTQLPQLQVKGGARQRENEAQ